jgi:glycosyltransferase involved in cell wall biosynthesis
MWTKYDLVLVNSRFSYEWYLRTVTSDIHKQIKQGHVPSLVVLYPPVQTYQGSSSALSLLPDKASVTNIAVVGRFYRGRHNKGHDLALRLFDEVVKQTSSPVRLHLIGN